jgi:RHS repeat-associated protein
MKYDSVSGSYKSRGRTDISPTLGRPFQVDPIRFAAGDVNLYRWEANNPTTHVDPSGLFLPFVIAGLTVEELLLLGGVAGGGAYLWSQLPPVRLPGLEIPDCSDLVPNIEVFPSRDTTLRPYYSTSPTREGGRLLRDQLRGEVRDRLRDPFRDFNDPFGMKGTFSNGLRRPWDDVCPSRTEPLRGLDLPTLMHVRTGKWAQGSYKSPEASLEYHFDRHGDEVGAADIDSYLRKAEGFAQNLKGATKSRVDGATPGVTRYKKNGKYIDLDADGKIISFGAQ